MNRQARRAETAQKRKRRGRQEWVASQMESAKQAHQAGLLEDAEAAYNRILEQNPDQPEALHYKGILLHQQGRSADGIAHLTRAISSRPPDAELFNNLGNIYRESGRTEDAVVAYQKSLAVNPQHVDALSNLGAAQLHLGAANEALAALNKAITLSPGHASAHMNLGAAQRKLGRLTEAIESYQAAIALQPGLASAYSHLSRLLLKVGRPDDATEVYRRWLVQDPDNPIARHMVAAATGRDTPPRASDDYVAATFDSFADTFDTVLDGLGYRAPELIGSVIKARFRSVTAELDVLDAGCGTGLCGPLLRPIARYMAGVDLSPRMIDKARGRGEYDQLEVAELTGYLSAHSHQFDLIVSADTLCYFGKLEQVVSAAFGALRDGGTMIFTLEHLSDPAANQAYRLNAHGRYSHCPDYAQTVLIDTGFTVLSVSSETLRQEGGAGVSGQLLVAQRMGPTV